MTYFSGGFRKAGDISGGFRKAPSPPWQSHVGFTPMSRSVPGGFRKAGDILGGFRKAPSLPWQSHVGFTPMSSPAASRVWRIAFVLGLVVGMVLVGGVVFADVIVPYRGEPKTDVTIVAARWDQIEFQTGEQASKLQGNSIERIERDSRQLGAARRLLETGSYTEAAKQFADLSKKASQDWEKSEAAYFVGHAYRLAGDHDKAVTAFEEYLGANQESKDWWVPHAIYELGLTQIDRGDRQAAEEPFSKLSSFGKNWALRSRIGVGHVLAMGGDHLEARNAFKEAESRRAPLFLRQEAMIGRAGVLYTQKNYKNVVEELEKGFFSALNGEIVFNRFRAQATLLTGKAYKAQGGKENLENAEIWFLKVAALYGNFPSEVRVAAGGLAEVYDELGRKDRAAAWRSRAAKSPETLAKKTKKRKKRKKQKKK